MRERTVAAGTGMTQALLALNDWKGVREGRKKERWEQRIIMIPVSNGERIAVSRKERAAACCSLTAPRHKYHHAVGNGRLRLRLTVRSTTLELTSATPLVLSNLSSKKAEK